MNVLKKISKFLNMILGYVCFIAFFAIMAFIVVNVLMRFLFNNPVLGAYEIVEQMMFVGVFTSFAYAQQQGSHIRVTMLLLKLPKKVSMILCALMSLLGTGVLGLLTYAAYKQMVLCAQHSYTSAMLKFSLTPFYVLEVVCSAIFAFALLVDTIEYITAIFKSDVADELAAKF